MEWKDMVIGICIVAVITLIANHLSGNPLRAMFRRSLKAGEVQTDHQSEVKEFITSKSDGEYIEIQGKYYTVFDLHVTGNYIFASNLEGWPRSIQFETLDELEIKSPPEWVGYFRALTHRIKLVTDLVEAIKILECAEEMSGWSHEKPLRLLCHRGRWFPVVRVYQDASWLDHQLKGPIVLMKPGEVFSIIGDVADNRSQEVHWVMKGLVDEVNAAALKVPAQHQPKEMSDLPWAPYLAS